MNEAARPALRDALGDSTQVIYNPGAVSCTAIVGTIASEDVDDPEHGLRREQVREVMIGRDELADPDEQPGVITIDGEDWNVQRMIDQSDSWTVLRCVRKPIAEITGQGQRAR